MSTLLEFLLDTFLYVVQELLVRWWRLSLALTLAAAGIGFVCWLAPGSTARWLFSIPVALAGIGAGILWQFTQTAPGGVE